MNPFLSPYEGRLDDLNGKTCFGRIVSVDEKLRRCRVKTLGKGITDDLDLPNVQWINLSSSADGDEDTCLPRISAYGVIVFINSEPYILGYYSPIPASGSDEPTEKVPLLPGDRILKTFAGNRIIVRSGGSVEIESTKLCRIFLLPSRNLMTQICQEYELEADGGYVHWTRDRKSGDTLLRQVIYDNLKPENAVILEWGKTTTDDLVHLQLGAYDAESATIKKPTLELSIKETGDVLMTVGDQKMTLKIDAATGDTLIKADKMTVKMADGKIGIGVDGKELLKQIVASFTALGNIQVLTPLGPSSPIKAVPTWSLLEMEFMKIKDITGDVSA